MEISKKDLDFLEKAREALEKSNMSKDMIETTMNMLKRNIEIYGSLDKAQEFAELSKAMFKKLSTYKCPMCDEEQNVKDSSLVVVYGKKEYIGSKGKPFFNGFFGSSGTEITHVYYQNKYHVRICPNCIKKYRFWTKIDIEKAKKYNAIVDIF